MKSLSTSKSLFPGDRGYEGSVKWSITNERPPFKIAKQINAPRFFSHERGKRGQKHHLLLDYRPVPDRKQLRVHLSLYLSLSVSASLSLHPHGARRLQGAAR